MKLLIYSLFLALCFTIFSCSHNPYDAFEEVQVGNDKQEVLQKVGSPLRSKFQNGKNIWTYRFYDKNSDTLIYKDIVLDSTKVIEIRDAKDTSIKEIQEKEKIVEESIKKEKTTTQTPPAKSKPVIDDAYIDKSLKENKKDTFVPVE